MAMMRHNAVDRIGFYVITIGQEYTRHRAGSGNQAVIADTRRAVREVAGRFAGFSRSRRTSMLSV